MQNLLQIKKPKQQLEFQLNLVRIYILELSRTRGWREASEWHHILAVRLGEGGVCGGHNLGGVLQHRDLGCLGVDAEPVQDWLRGRVCALLELRDLVDHIRQAELAWELQTGILTSMIMSNSSKNSF